MVSCPFLYRKNLWIRFKFSKRPSKAFCKNELSTKITGFERERQFVLTAGEKNILTPPFNCFYAHFHA